MFYTVYKVTNLVNGKSYVGKHQTTNLDDDYMGSGKLIIRAIKKYGIHNFKKAILFVFDNETDMNNKERELVTISESSYNLCDGGKGGWGYVNRTGLNVSDNQKTAARRLAPLVASKGGRASQKTLQERKLGIYNRAINGFNGKTHTDEWKRNHSDVMKLKQKGQGNSQYGTCWITNGIENKKIRKEDYDNFVVKGYYKGRI